MNILRRLRESRSRNEPKTIQLTSQNDTVKRRILVLGTLHRAKNVTAYTWDDLPQSLNVSDYDVVILNLVPLAREIFSTETKNQLPSWQQFARLLFSPESEIIAIGVPGAYIRGPDADDPVIARRLPLGGSSLGTVTWWLPVRPHTVQEEGTEIRNVDPSFTYYFQHVRNWKFFARNEIYHDQYPNPRDFIAIADQGANDLLISFKPIAETRTQHAIAFELQLQAIRQTRPPREYEPFVTPTTEPLKTSGKVIWLPPTTAISDSQAVDLILQERYGVQLNRDVPDWIENYKLPKQEQIEAQIAQREQEIHRLIQSLTEEITLVRDQLQSVTRFQQILYEQGENDLEPPVRDALRELGAHVEEPKRRGREDGRLTDLYSRKGMLEIKGHKGALRVEDVRQLPDWCRDAEANESWSSKGIIIANLYCTLSPQERAQKRQSEIFPPNCVQVAKNFNICLMTTTQLFRALCEHR